ncbi:MAG: DUF4114 domain-containing protein [Candidatus Bipolaricaulaceae bacterium]
MVLTQRQILGLVGIFSIAMAALCCAQEPNLYTWMMVNGYHGVEVSVSVFPPGRYRISVLARFTVQHNSCGFYYVLRFENPVSFCALRELIDGRAPVGSTTYFSAAYDFGLYMNSIADLGYTLGGIFFTQEHLNFNKRQHAKIIQIGYNTWIIGWEDYLDFDYNDLIVLLQRM